VTVAASDPGDRAFDHGSVLTVVGDEPWICCAGAVGAGQRVVFAESHRFSGGAAGASLAQQALSATGGFRTPKATAIRPP